MQHVTNTLMEIYGRVTNDKACLRSVFLEIVPRAFPAFLSFLQHTPDALSMLSSLNNPERSAALCGAALAQIPLLSLPAHEPLPLVWPAPAQKISEVV